MSEAKHTQGPWQVSNWYSTSGQSCGISNGILGVAAVYGTGRTEAEANARLVASAPELVAAVRALLTYFSTKTDDAPCVVAARAAVAKALGEAA